MIPHERSLVEKLAGKPFALIGVNSDKDRDVVKQRVAKDRVSWRNFWDGTEGPIAKAWNVHVFPSTFLIDADGVVRFRDLDDGELEAAIAGLLDELARKGPAKGGR